MRAAPENRRSRPPGGDTIPQSTTYDDNVLAPYRLVTDGLGILPPAPRRGKLLWAGIPTWLWARPIPLMDTLVPRCVRNHRDFTSNDEARMSIDDRIRNTRLE